MEQPLIQAIYLTLAALIGVLMGLERKIHSSGEKRFMGVGFFTGFSILGFLITALPSDYEFLIYSISGFIALVVLALPVLKSRKGRPGMTTSASLVISFLLGSMVGLHMILECLFIATLIIPMLSFKERLHRFASILTDEELSSTLRFLSVAAILLPLAYTARPLHPLVGPGRLFDPVKIIIMIIFISAISFSGYLSMKIFKKDRGLTISSFMGGFVSSAAATASISQKSGKRGELRSVAVKGVLLANVSMLLKDLLLISVLGGGRLLSTVIPAYAVLLLVSISTLLFWGGEGEVRGDIELGTPFALIPATKFAVLFGLISTSSVFLKRYLGSFGIYAVSVGGLVSTTSVSASLGNLFSGGIISPVTATSVLLLATVFGSLFKITIVGTYDRKMAKRCSVPLTIIALTAAAMVLILLFMGK